MIASTWRGVARVGLRHRLRQLLPDPVSRNLRSSLKEVRFMATNVRIVVERCETHPLLLAH
jgi:hypothetical protein